MLLSSTRELGIQIVACEFINLTKALQCFPHASQADEERVAFCLSQSTVHK
jgi:hypothetical protein